MAKKKKSVPEIMTDIFIKRVEAKMAEGDFSIPWKKTWDPIMGMPRGLESNKAYRGSNVIMTLCQGFNSPLWVTAKQLTKLGGKIRKTADDKFEEYTPITFWWFPDPKNPKDEGRRPFVAFYRVYNTEQVEGIENYVAAKLKGNGEPVNTIESAEALCNRWTSGPDVSHGSSKAVYYPSADRIELPAMMAFDTAEDYYRARFHEMIHGTGHRNRLERDGIVNPIKFASHRYSEEELIAEFGSAMLAGHCGIATEEADDNSAAYLKFWLKKLRAEPKLLELAGRSAQKGVDMVRGIKWEKAA